MMETASTDYSMTRSRAAIFEHVNRTSIDWLRSVSISSTSVWHRAFHLHGSTEDRWLTARSAEHKYREPSMRVVKLVNNCSSEHIRRWSAKLAWAAARCFR